GPFALNFASGQVSSNLLIGVVNDTNANPNRVFGVQLTGAPLWIQSTGTVTILNEDSQVSFASTNYTVNENDTVATITVSRLFSAFGAVSVGYFTTAGTAAAYPGSGPVAGFDYTNVNATLTWTDGDGTDKTFTVGIIDNLLTNSDKTVNLFLTNVAGVVGTPAL